MDGTLYRTDFVGLQLFVSVTILMRIIIAQNVLKETDHLKKKTHFVPNLYACCPEMKNV